MKALLAGLLMAGTFLPTAEAAPVVSAPAQRVVKVAPNAYIIIKVTIYLGRSRGCTGSGVCGITVEVSWSTAMARTGSSFGTAEMDANNRLKVVFYRASMDAATLRAHFATNTFTVDDDFALPTDVAAALGVRAYTIAAGKYPITAVGNDFVVVF